MAWVSAQIPPYGGPRSPGWVPEVGSAFDSPRGGQGEGTWAPTAVPAGEGLWVSLNLCHVVPRMQPGISTLPVVCPHPENGPLPFDRVGKDTYVPRLGPHQKPNLTQHPQVCFRRQWL